MSQTPPRVYIDGRLMDSYAADNMPVIQGMTLDWGTDTDIDMPGVETLQLQLLIREPGDLGFLELGKVVALWQPAEDGVPAYTVFVGRIQRLSADLQVKKSGNRLLITVNASDLLADLTGETVSNVNNASTNAAGRLSALAYWTPEDWTLLSFAPRFPARVHAPIIYKQKNYLELLDQFLRVHLMKRMNFSTYTPGSGITRELAAFEDATNDLTADKLTLQPDRTWGVKAGVPASGQYAVIRMSAKRVHADAGWTKEPDDVITDVSLQRVDTWNGTDDVGTTPVSSRVHVNTAAARRAYGVRSLEFNTDLPAGGPAADLLPIFEQWLSTESLWRAKHLRVINTADFSAQVLQSLLSTKLRARAFLIITDPTESRPDHTQADVRGAIIGGRAQWTGTKWELEFTLGRVPGLPADGDYWTFAGLAANTTFAAGTAESVGTEIAFNSFARIGKP